MTKSSFFTTVLTFLSFVLLLSCKHETREDSLDKKPNIIIIYADDLGYGDLSSYGSNIATPNIDRIGEEGIRFTDFYVSAPACTPSRYSLLTGRYPQRSLHGLNEVIMPGDAYHFDESEVTLAELLKSKAYTTAIIGKWHLGSQEASFLPKNQGFDLFTGHEGGCIDYFSHVYGGMGHDWFVKGQEVFEEGYSTKLIADHAIDFINGAKDQSNPFFLYLPFNSPHYGKTDPDRVPEGTLSLKQGKYQGYAVMNSLQAPQGYIEQYAHIEDPYRRVYAAMVSSLDDNVGRLWTKLEAEGLLENTMIWFISDNGGYSESYHGHASNGKLRGEKASLWEGGIRVPALLCWKGKVKAKQVISQPLCNTDVLPTLGTITGFADTLAHLPIDGKDISEVLLDQKTIERDIYWRFREQTAFRRGDWKLHDFDELYKLKSDIGEAHNVAAQYPEKLKELQDAFKQMDKALDDHNISEPN